MHYAEFDEQESQALLAAIKEYDANKWKSIGTKLGKPAKVCLFFCSHVNHLLSHPQSTLLTVRRQACEQFAKQNFSGTK
jgi:hypothetical protein